MAIFSQALIYGWVSKYRDIIPYTILKIILIIKKKNDKYFINIFILLVDKDTGNHFIFMMDACCKKKSRLIVYKKYSLKTLKTLCFQKMIKNKFFFKINDCM